MKKSPATHDHQHSPNRFAVIPTHVRLDADPNFNGKGVTIAFLDSGFHPHPDLIEPVSRVLAFKDVNGETNSLNSHDMTESWRWHGTQTSVVAAGNGQLESVLSAERIVAAHYQHVDGTSFAAPIVSSIVAQMIEANPEITPGAVKNILISSANRIGSAPAVRQGYGMVNARRAVELAKGERHDLNGRGCIPPRIDNGRLVFVYHDDLAHSVSLAGDFNDWAQQRTPLSKDKSGLWVAEIPAPGPGSYRYKFVVDGHRWLEDPSNGMKVSNNFGGLNSLLVVE